MHARPNLLADMCHDIRSPLGSLTLAALRLADSGRIPAECRRDADRLRNAGEHLIARLDDMLLLYRLDAQALPVAARPFDPGGVLRDLCTLLELEAEAAGAALTLALAVDAPSQVVGDPDRLTRIVTNLIDNAVRHSACAAICVRLLAGQGGGYHVVVEDDGVGMADDRPTPVPRRAVQAGTTAAGGHGLGLAICRGLVESLGGDMAFANAGGGGLRVTVTLPTNPRMKNRDGSCEGA